MGKMRLPEEFKEFINLLNTNKVKYLLLGGWAVGYYSNPRATKDIDFLVYTDNTNLKKLNNVFYDFKAPPINVEILKEEKGFLFIGSPPLRIEVISNADGINIKDCYKRKNVVEIDGIKINIISKDDLIINKKSTNRLKDHSDAEVIENCKINPDINTKNVLKSRLILANIVGAYGRQLKEESAHIKKRKKDDNYKNDLNIIKKTILLYNKALDTKSEKDIFALHKSFKRDPRTNNIDDIFRYKILRIKIYNEIEYRYKLLLKNEYSYLINNIHTRHPEQT
jgi:hypothetical protein